MHSQGKHFHYNLYQYFSVLYFFDIWLGSGTFGIKLYRLFAEHLKVLFGIASSSIRVCCVFVELFANFPSFIAIAQCLHLLCAINMKIYSPSKFSPSSSSFEFAPTNIFSHISLCVPIHIEFIYLEGANIKLNTLLRVYYIFTSNKQYRNFFDGKTGKIFR